MKSPAKIFLFFLIFEFISSISASAYQPFATEDASVIGHKKIEFEATHDFFENNQKGHSFVGNYTPQIGLFDWSEFDLTVPVIYAYWHRKSGENGGVGQRVTLSGIGDLQFLGKFICLRETRKLPSVVLVGQIGFPTGDPNLGMGSAKTNYQTLGAFTKSFYQFTFHANVGWNFFTDQRGSIVIRAAVDYKFLDKFHVVAEWDGKNDLDPETNGDGSAILSGLIWDIRPNLSLDLAVRAGLIHSDEKFRITQGITWQLN